MHKTPTEWRATLALPLLCLLLAACAPALPPLQDAPAAPYLTNTPAATVTPNVFVWEETPQPTATPFMYVIQSGDTFSGLAEKFGVSVEALRAANPNIAPSRMPVGGTLLIPDSSAPAALAATPSPLPILITQVFCYPSADSGLHCFALIQNSSEAALANVSVQVTLYDKGGKILAAQAAFPPLDLIPPNAALPAYVFFPRVPADAIPQAQTLSAMNAGTPPSMLLTNTVIAVQRGGLYAELSGQVYLPPESNAATHVWVAAIAYNERGQVCGVRRWEGGELLPGGLLPFEFSIASLSGKIARVEFFAQSQP
ncbi:MAG: hypothetical protein Fur002_13420 [Anaerolineales bacterium]